MRRPIITAALAGWCSLLLTLPSLSQSSATVSFQIASYQNLSIWGERSDQREILSLYRIPQPTPQERAAGWIERPKALQLVARSNLRWALRVRSLEPTMGLSDDGQSRKPVSDLYVRTPQYEVSVSVRDQTIAHGPAGEFLVPIDYRVRLGPDHRDGHYHVTLVYTLSTP
ncbi:MAG: hypothetical protein NZ610_08050 [Candidatus Bipolaricaulota bacterium]|nr:hypothetical protein [Candidatus Bipolaricaulota bacterium]MCS7275328.1 hypothetical protein [Candidatus Bipolaricaulota bacterium]MDW8110173.1 hypothetical protein [Candidatus Bipolaricaulota bacterium]MDW8329205.1 hypothetical protein [Candidatus Bipolaricaulota bacterium]